MTLPAFLNHIDHQCAKDEENEQGYKHVVDSPDVVHLKKLTAETQKGGISDTNVDKQSLSCRNLNEVHINKQLFHYNIFISFRSTINLLQEGPATDKLLALAMRRPEIPKRKTERHQ